VCSGQGYCHCKFEQRPRCVCHVMTYLPPFQYVQLLAVGHVLLWLPTCCATGLET
jgi:hypothetical protein